MIAKITIKTNSLENLAYLEDKYTKEYKEFVEYDPSSTFTITVDEKNLELTIKTFTLAEAVN